MSMISYAAGARFINLLGGEMLSFYDWYADLPPASPKFGVNKLTYLNQVIGTMLHILLWGSNVPLTRTPDAHFMTEVRYKGLKLFQ